MRGAMAVAILAFVLAACVGGTGGAGQPAPPPAAPASKPVEKAAAPAPPSPAAPAAAPAKPAQPAAAPPKSAAAQFVYRLGQSSSATHPLGIMAIAFKNEVEKNSNGRITVELFHGGALGGEVEMVKAVRAGQLDLGAFGTAASATLSPALNMTLLPYFFPDGAAARRVLDSTPGQMALKALEQQGVKGFAWGEIGFAGLLTSRKPIDSAEDVKGMKIRVVENPLFVATWRALGANPVPMAFPEVYTGLQQRAIDGVDTTYQAMADSKFYEVAKYLALTNQTYFGSLLMMNLAKFQALPAELQKVVEDAAKVGAAESRKAGQKADDTAIELMKKQGVATTTPPRAALEAATKTVHDEFAPKIGAEIVAAARAMLDRR
ncbi:MAG: TRAP transporter substrate-binding protein [Chloroflexi bacterium]|nr:TRAP transporter substrate-binding protein [Chloroflexota bacterium]